ncbi:MULTISPECIES: oxygenase MpaB family protein [unclassified Nonomuraea]|uniref:oxygenase MpaB family protein n=1 Tax=unclassified Nonomuraea TaxID=2593643 RepID=UPI00191C106F|nr:MULTISPECIES: oxygenase MpaB family protein [unclassified Nonomuraea]
MRPSLRVTREAAETVRFLMWPRLPRELRMLSLAKPGWLPFSALCYHTLPEWARRMYGVLPEVPAAAVTAGLRAFRLAMNALPEPVHDLAFMPATRRMLRASRERLGAAGYDVSRGLRGLTGPG